MKQAKDITKTFDIRKRSINNKLIQSDRSPKQQFIVQTKKAMGKKYMQQNIFKAKPQKPQKQLRQIVMSQEFIRSSKLYKLMKQKMQMNDALYMKELNHINDKKYKLKGEIMELKSKNYQEKIGLWEMKNQLMELRLQQQQEDDEGKELDRRAQMYYQEGEYGPQQEEENQMQADEDDGEEGEQDAGDSDSQQVHSQKCNSLGQRQEGSESQEPDLGNIVSNDTAKFSQILKEIMELRAAKKVEQQNQQNLKSEIQQQEKATQSKLIENQCSKEINQDSQAPEAPSQKIVKLQQKDYKMNPEQHQYE